MPRKRFKLSCVASSEGAHVARAHKRYIREEHEKFALTIQVSIPKKYFVKCFGKLIQITEREALMHGKANIIIK